MGRRVDGIKFDRGGDVESGLFETKSESTNPCEQVQEH